ncbi:MAG: solute carrier family 23 protein [Dehalococcoidales bacterium]
MIGKSDRALKTASRVNGAVGILPKPPNLIYGVNDRPPILFTLFMGFQHVCFYAISLSFPVIIVRAIGGTDAQATFMISMSMIAGGIGAIIMALPKGPVGSGYLCPPVCSPTNLAAALTASKFGGLSLLYGMTLISGVSETIFSRLVNKLRVLFPPEITGLIVAMVGITVIRVACLNFLGLDQVGTPIEPKVLIVSFSTLAVIVGLNIWGKGKLGLFCVLVGMVLGYILSYVLGLMSSTDIAAVSGAGLVWFPFLYHPGWSFSLSLVIPYLIVMVCSAVKTVGDITTCQKINNAKWTRPDMKNIGKGILADGLSDVASGLLGGTGQSTSSSNVGLTIATKTTSRVVAYATGGLLIIIAFIPKVSSLFAIMPKPVMGASLIFAISFMIVSGIQIMTSRMLDTRKIIVIGVSIIFGIMVDLMPEAFANLPTWISPVFSSSLSTAAITAICLNLIFRIGIAKSQTIELEPKVDSSEKIFNFMEKAGASWGARKEIINQAASAINEFFESATGLNIVKGKIKTEVSFDEFNLDVNITYDGTLMEFPVNRPSADELMADERAFTRLSAFLINSRVDKIKSSAKDGHCHLQLHFDH